MKKRYRCVEIRYIPNLLEDQSAAIGVMIWDPADSGFVAVSKRTDWSAIARLDPDADIEFLSAAVDQIEQEFRQRDQAGRERLIGQLSMNIAFSGLLEIEADDPCEALKQVARGL